MIKLPKKVAFVLFILVTILLAVSFNYVNWNVFESSNSFSTKFIELREPLIFLILAVFYIKYYVDILKEEKK
tara:strand:- start:141 stop:356 length:216 start_codon:yes stop_codon:yes gene_type:complete